MKTAGMYKIPGKFLKNRVEIPAKYLDEICNFSITFITFLNVWKIVKISFIF